MPLVLDASVAAAWCFPDEASAVADATLALLAQDQAIVPALFWYEVWNFLLIGERRGRIAAADTSRFLTRLTGLIVEVEPALAGERVPDLARRHGLTAYDAAYLDLAQRRDLPLSSLDRRLVGAARAEGLALVEA